MDKLLQYLIFGLGTGGIYALMAVGFVLVFKATKILNFAHGDLVMLSGYVGVIFLVQMGLPVWVGLLLTVVSAAIIAAAVNRFLMRPMIGQPLMSTIMITIVLISVIGAACNMVWGRLVWRYPRFMPMEAIFFKGLMVSREALFFLVASAVLLIALSLVFYRTRLGLAMRVVAEDSQVAKAMGIGVNLIFAITWALYGVICGVAAIFLGYLVGISGGLSLIALRALPAALIGGLESIPGAVIAGLLIGASEGLASAYIDPLVGMETASIFPYIIMIVIIIIRPYGFFGLKRVERI